MSYDDDDDDDDSERSLKIAGLENTEKDNDGQKCQV